MYRYAIICIYHEHVWIRTQITLHTIKHNFTKTIYILLTYPHTHKENIHPIGKTKIFYTYTYKAQNFCNLHQNTKQNVPLFEYIAGD